MKLFKNGVGRPSNEIKKKRKMFIVSLVVLVILFVLITGFILQGINTKKIQGAVTTKDKLKKEIVGFDKINAEIVGFANMSPYKSSLVKDKKTGEYWKKTNKGKYCKGTIEINANKSNKISDIYIEYTGAYHKDVSTEKGVSYMNPQKYSEHEFPSKMSFMMEEPVKVGEKNVFKLEVESVNFKDVDTDKKIYLSDIRTMKTTHYYEAKFGENCKKVSLKYVKSEYESSPEKPELECPSEEYVYKKLRCDTNFRGKDVKWKINGKDRSKDAPYGNILETDYLKEKDIGDMIVEVTALGLPKLTKKIKIKAPLAYLRCPTSAFVNEPFKCTAGSTGIKMTVSAAKSLAPGYSSTFTATGEDITKDIKYTSKLFTDYKSKIKKDSDGKEYINISVTASFEGHTSTTKIVKIYKQPTPTTMYLNCPTSKKIGETFKCTANQEGVKITVGGAKSLAPGYTSSFTTDEWESDKSISIKYSSKLFTDYKSQIKKDSKGRKYIKVKIQASKKGYKTVTKYVNIYYDNKVADRDSKKSNFDVAAVWSANNKTNTTVKFKIIQGAFGSKVKYVAYVVCEEELECTANNAWDIMNNKEPGSVTKLIKAKKGDEVILKFGASSYDGYLNGKTYYIRRTTYDSNKKILYYSVYAMSLDHITKKDGLNKVHNTTLKHITQKFY